MGFLGYTDPETDEERSEVLPCRRCSEREAVEVVEDEG